jgi:erythronate-4-phosphate dehydrogenase
MTANDLADADVVLVRSVTRVDASLLAQSPARFVGTATIGTDHIDEDHLASRGIAFSSAAGSNANSVAEYVMAQLLTLGDRLGINWAGRTLGVVGVGNIGRLVVRNATAMGMRVLQNDPPRQRAEGGDAFVGLDTVCAESDVITLHIPLIREGTDRTVHLFDRDRLARLRSDTILLNSARGAAIDNAALRIALKERCLRAVGLDVWENEPTIDVGLMAEVAIATAHIAGYSLDGKIAGTKMLFDAVCRAFDLTDTWEATDCLPPPIVGQIDIDPSGPSDQAVCREVVRRIYDIETDDVQLRTITDLPPDERGDRFDLLRKVYPVRREFFNTRVVLSGGSESLRGALRTWGFRVDP